jgi:hypothetical protein
MDLFDKPLTATDFLIDIIRHTEGRMGKAELKEKWTGHKWSTQGLTEWARWIFRENVK